MSSENLALPIKKIFCNTCKFDTNHEIKSQHDRSYEETYTEYGRQHLCYYEYFVYKFLVCRGCDTASLEEKWTNDGMRNHEGEVIYSYEYSPQRNNLGVREAKRFLHIDKKLNDTYKEIITSQKAGLGIVTSMGIRALLEGICVTEGIDDKTAWGLKKKIEALSEKINIPSSIIDGLKGIKFIGDDAAHRLNASDKNSISLSIDLLEALLTHLYEAKFDLQHKAELVKKAHNIQN